MVGHAHAHVHPDTTCACVRARARTSLFSPLGEKKTREGRAPFSFSCSFFSFSRRAYPSYRLTAVSHYGSIWSAFRNLVILFDRYNLNPAIAEQALKDPPRGALPTHSRHYGFKQHLGLRNSIIRLISRSWPRALSDAIFIRQFQLLYSCSDRTDIKITGEYYDESLYRRNE